MRDYLSEGLLSGPLYVSGCRILRHLSIDGFYAGAIYVNSEEYPQNQTIARPLGDRVTFTLQPYERNHRNRDLMACGKAHSHTIPTSGPVGHHQDSDLWNMAAAELIRLSDAVTDRFSKFTPQYRRGTWECCYVGTSGVGETLWEGRPQLKAHSLKLETSKPRHFMARSNKGTILRLVPRYEQIPHTWGRQSELTVSAMHLGGPVASVPKYLKEWVLSRTF